MNPKTYQSLLKKVHLQSLWLDALEAVIHREVFDPDVQPRVQVDLRDSLEVSPGEGFDVLATLRFTARIRRKTWVRVTIQMRARYVFSETDAPQEFYEVFRETSARLHYWPYLRELLSNTLLRMGLPPYPLPLYLTKES